MANRLLINWCDWGIQEEMQDKEGKRRGNVKDAAVLGFQAQRKSLRQNASFLSWPGRSWNYQASLLDKQGRFNGKKKRKKSSSVHILCIMEDTQTLEGGVDHWQVRTGRDFACFSWTAIDVGKRETRAERHLTAGSSKSQGLTGEIVFFCC